MQTRPSRIRSLNPFAGLLRNRFHGHIDMFSGGIVAGWIKRRGDDAPIRVDVFIDDICIARNLVADVMRADLREAGHASGRYGFEIVPKSTFSGRESVTVSVRIAGEARPFLSRSFILPAISTGAIDAAPPDGGDTTGEVWADPVDEDYTCRIERFDTEQISGWCTDNKEPGRVFDIDVLIDGVAFTTTRNDLARGDLARKGLSDGLGGVRALLPLRHLDSGEHRVGFRMPNGYTLERSIEIRETRRHAPFSLPEWQGRGISVVVPIYNAVDDVRVCIERLARYTPETTDILLIDDCSSDPAMADVLSPAALPKNMRVLRNKRNLGFTRTVNRGLADTGDNDVVILNSDARVTPGWLEGLSTAARSGPRIATVTAMSDRAGAFSAPRIGNDNELPDGVDEITFARAFRRRSTGLYPAVPTGNGFCMYISRACLNEIGHFDAEAFPRGYGEENDFCMRAGRAGWRNIIDDRTYVFHDREKSFGAAKPELLAAGRAVLDERYPDYKLAIGVFSTDDRIALARFRAAEAIQDCLEPAAALPRLLFVTGSRTGGVPLTNRDLMVALAESFDCWNLRCDSRNLELIRMVDGEARLARQYRLDEPVDPLTHRSMEYDAVVRDWLLRYGFELVHIRHLGWHSLSLPALAKHMNVKVVFSFHDFYALSPTIKLIDDTGEFRGESFDPAGSPFRQSLWPRGSQPIPSGEWGRQWRERFRQALQPCDAFVTTSHSARSLILQGLPDLPAERFEVIPHGRDFAAFAMLRAEPQDGEPLRLLVPGNIDQSKGLEIIRALAEYDRDGRLEFHILGNTNLLEPEAYPRIIRHGQYDRDDFAARTAAIEPHLGIVFSIWDETYCHTLTELWSVGLPVAVFDFPTVAGRVRESGGGWVLDRRNIPALYENLLALAADKEDLAAKDAALARWQATEGRTNTTSAMAARYLETYRALLQAR